MDKKHEYRVAVGSGAGLAVLGWFAPHVFPAVPTLVSYPAVAVGLLLLVWGVWPPIKDRVASLRNKNATPANGTPPPLTPEERRRLKLVVALKADYFREHYRANPGQLLSGEGLTFDEVPAEWINQRLKERGEIFSYHPHQPLNKRGIRNTIGAFVLEGKKLQNRCKMEALEAPTADVKAWDDKVAKFLGQIELSLIAYFRNHAGMPMERSGITSPLHEEMWQGIRFRLARLHEIMQRFEG